MTPPRAGQRDRRRAERRGRLAEAYAAVILTLKGYFIIISSPNAAGFWSLWR